MEKPGEEERSYDLGDVRPEVMERVGKDAERAALNNGIDNRKNLVDRYVCEECGGGFSTVAVDVGVVPYFAGCDTEGCRGSAKCRTSSMREHVDGYEGKIDFEWYRPVTEEECETAVLLVEAESDTLAANPRIPQEEGTRGFYAELGKKDRARELLCGGLLRRPRAGTHS